MMTFYSWILENKQWLFEGVGVTLLIGIGWYVKKIFYNDNPNKQIQTSGDGSVNIQSGESVNFDNVTIKTDTKNDV